PAIYARPYRIKLSPNLVPGCLSLTDNLAAGLEPGDLTKRNGVPWQADFNECSTQPIDLTYEGWNATYPGSTGEPVTPVQQTVYWWPSHRPMTVTSATGRQLSWSGDIPAESTGDFTMVTAWKNMGFVCDFTMDPDNPNYVLVEGWNSEPPIMTDTGGRTGSEGTSSSARVAPAPAAPAEPSRAT
ncbi:MAG: LodA/GoxA family CTQ-dependent oxidase, partial [Byssovorax sp.]